MESVLKGPSVSSGTKKSAGNNQPKITNSDSNMPVGIRNLGSTCGMAVIMQAKSTTKFAHR